MVLPIMMSFFGVISQPAPTGNADALIEKLRPALAYVRQAARVYYAATCPSAAEGFVFPDLHLQPPADGATGMEAIREIFQGDRDVTVNQDESGMVRIMIGNLSTAILQTKIHALTLPPFYQYNPAGAVVAIEETPEVVAAEDSLNVRRPRGIDDIFGSVASIEGAAHLPAVMRNVTVDEALDSIAKTFKGVVVYGTCTDHDGQDLYRLDFVEWKD